MEHLDYINEEIPTSMAPNYVLIQEIYEAARVFFQGMPITPKSLYDMETYFNDRIDELIYLGEFRTHFVTPQNREVKWKQILVMQDKQDPSKVVVHPFWVYVKKEEKDNGEN